VNFAQELLGYLRGCPVVPRFRAWLEIFPMRLPEIFSAISLFEKYK
jgi:hypothetical protein